MQGQEATSWFKKPLLRKSAEKISSSFFFFPSKEVLMGSLLVRQPSVRTREVRSFP